MLLQMALIHSFLWLSSIPLYMYHAFFYTFIYCWTFRFFSVFWILRIVLLRRYGCMYLSESWFCMGIFPGVGLPDYMVISDFSFLTKIHTVFHSCTCLYSHSLGKVSKADFIALLKENSSMYSPIYSNASDALVQPSRIFMTKSLA